MVKELRTRTGFQRLLTRGIEAHLLFPLLAFCIVAAIWLSTYHLIRVESAAAERRAAESALELVETYEAQMIRNLGTIDQTLKTIAYLHAMPQKQALLASLKENGVLPPTLVFSVAIADKDGTIIETTSDKENSVDQEPFFARHRESDDGRAAVSLVRAGDGAERLRFSRRLDSPDKSFSGVAIVSVRSDYFTSGYEPARLGRNGVLGLVDERGIFLVKRTGDEITSGQALGRTLLGADLFKTDSPLLLNPWDGVERYTNARALYGFPLMILTGLSRAEQLARLDKQKRIYIGTATAATVLVILAAAMLTALSWQLAKNRRRIRKDQETYYAASEASLEAILVLRRILDRQNNAVGFVLDSVNNRGAQMFDKARSELLGKSICELLPQCRDNGFLEALVNVDTTGCPHEKEWENDFPALQAKWLYRQMVQVEDGVVVILRDITERKEAEARISHMAHHDALTGLPNRTLLEDRIRQAIVHGERYQQSVAVAFIDLDNFKLVNDSLGHEAGDELLRIVSSRMVQCLRQTDTVVRLGGDEFIIVLLGYPEGTTGFTRALEKIRNAIAEPVHLHNQKLEITFSAGVAIYPDDGKDSSTLLSNADAAMYEAKAQGRNNFQYYTAEMNARILGKITLQEGLRHAAVRNEFFLVYQPQIDLRTGIPLGVEALLRWRHQEKGLIPPSSFIELAEETGLILPIGEWVLRTACRQAKAWQEAGAPPVRVSVNVSARQFRHNNLAEQVNKALQESGLAPQYLDLELTESLIMQDVKHAISVMRELQAMGVQLSIDDFGIGYSSLSTLKSFPITRLKLDKSFVGDLPADLDDAAITKAVIALGHELQLEVLAEGVETSDQLSFLRENGCDLVQGNYLSKPLAAADLPRLLGIRDHNALLVA